MIKGLALRPVLPDLAAALRSLAGVALIAAVAVQWGPAGSAAAAVATGAIAGATAFQDSPRSRVPLVYLVSALAGLAVLLGALTSAVSVLFVVVAALWCFGAAMLWGHGPNAGMIGAATSALLVAAPPIAPTAGAALGTAALAVAGGLVQAVVLALWPPQRWRDQRDALVGAYRSLAADARRLGRTDDDWSVDTEPLVALREAFMTEDGPHRRRPAVYRGWYALPERIAATLIDVSTAARSDALSRVLDEAADVMAAVADTSRSGRIGTDVAITRFDTVAGEVDGPEEAVVQRLTALLHEVAAMRLGDFVPSTPDAVRLRRPELPTSVRSAIDTVRDHLRWHSPVLRHAVRLGVAVALGCAVERYAGAPHGYWIPLTVLLVLRPETAHTYTRCVGRLAGNAAGIIAASTVLMVLDPGVALATSIAVIAVGIAYLASGSGYVAVSATVTAAAVFLTDVTRTTDASVSGPLLAALVGGGLAVAAHVALPDDELTRLAQRAGELLKTEIDYAATVIKGYVHEVDSPAESMASAWQRAFRARAAFEATTGAMRIESRELRHWLRSYRTALNAVTSACTSLEAHLPARPAATADREFVLAVDEYVEALCGDPPTAALPWTLDSAELQAADQRLRDAVPRHGSDDAPARVLVAEVATITRSLSAIAVSSGPTSAR